MCSWKRVEKGIQYLIGVPLSPLIITSLEKKGDVLVDLFLLCL